MALESADLATVGAIAGPLERHFHIGQTGLGLFASAGLLVAAAASLPAGVLADRVRRVPLLAGAVALLSAAMVAGVLLGDASPIACSPVATLPPGSSCRRPAASPPRRSSSPPW
jgi:MFS family permease